MRVLVSSPTRSSATKVLFVLGIAIGLVVCLAAPARADKSSDAREQFEQAVKMRTMLEGYLEKDRAVSDYKQTVSAYNKVYLITPQAEEVTPSLIAEAELYQEMGSLFDPKYFQSAVDTYQFLLKQYPRSRYGGEALLSIARIQRDHLEKTEAAEATYREYLKRFPRSEKADDARAALQEIASLRAKDQDTDPLPEVQGQPVEPREASGSIPRVTEIHTWNTPEATRVVVNLEDTVRYEAARIASPDRIYFDLYKARLSHEVAQASLDVQDGLLKSARIGQNKQGVVRLVLNVDGAKDYSAVLLSNPYRLVIDVQARAVRTRRSVPGPATAAAVPAKTVTVNSFETSSDRAAEAAPAKTAKSMQAREPAPTPSTKGSAKTAAAATTKTKDAKTAALAPPSVPKPTRDGQRSLTRALGLKISRIVIDPGHGGHDTGTIGPHGLMEKDLCLDVALRLGGLIEKKLPGAEVIYTRKDDTFIPLEQRTAIANSAKADLFISIHANSSRDPAARGVETYYLNFTASDDSMEVAARENSNSQASLHDLQDLIKKIARNEKLEESKELAGDIQGTLTERLRLVSRQEKNRGVKKAPFIVLIGANMPSVLSEISFVSNPNDERLLRNAQQRQRIADGLYHGIATYLDNLNSLSYNKQKLVSENHVSGDRLEAQRIVASAPK
jgi:N-acetylmuramoyl-L-alanine amidase